MPHKKTHEKERHKTCQRKGDTGIHEKDRHKTCPRDGKTQPQRLGHNRGKQTEFATEEGTHKCKQQDMIKKKNTTPPLPVGWGWGGPGGEWVQNVPQKRGQINKTQICTQREKGVHKHKHSLKRWDTRFAGVSCSSVNASRK